MKKGLMKLTMPIYPKTIGMNMIKSIKAAEDGVNPPVRLVSELPGGSQPSYSDIISPANLSSYTPQF